MKIGRKWERKHLFQKHEKCIYLSDHSRLLQYVRFIFESIRSVGYIKDLMSNHIKSIETSIRDTKISDPIHDSRERLTR